MNKLPAKVYYLLSTGEVLMVLAENESINEHTTKEQDINTFDDLKGRVADEIDFIEIPHGTFTTIFSGAIKSYSVDVQTKTINVIQYTQDELTTIQQQTQETQTTINRVNAISDYASLDNNAIDPLESEIISYATNLVTNGVG